MFCFFCATFESFELEAQATRKNEQNRKIKKVLDSIVLLIPDIDNKVKVLEI